MDAIRNSHTKWSESERETQILYDITYTWSLKYGTNESIYKTEIDSDMENRLVVTKVEGVRWTGSLGLVAANYSI